LQQARRAAKFQIALNVGIEHQQIILEKRWHIFGIAAHCYTVAAYAGRLSIHITLDVVTVLAESIDSPKVCPEIIGRIHATQAAITDVHDANGRREAVYDPFNSSSHSGRLI